MGNYPSQAGKVNQAGAARPPPASAAKSPVPPKRLALTADTEYARSRAGGNPAEPSFESAAISGWFFFGTQGGYHAHRQRSFTGIYQVRELSEPAVAGPALAGPDVLLGRRGLDRGGS